MPLRGVGHSKLVENPAPYFTTLAELDEWADQPRAKLTGLLEYRPRARVEGTADGRGRLLVNRTYLYPKIVEKNAHTLQGVPRL